jgi:K+-sensing histidine kinase KdpD
LQSRELNEEQKKFFLQNALSDTDRLNVLIENILQSASMDSGKTVIHKSKTNISKLLMENLNNLENSIGKNHRFQSKINPEIFAEVDQQAFISILINLVDNAVKYSPKDSEIKVQLLSNNNSFQLIVSDQGQGIKKEDRKKIFEKFLRIQNEETRSAKGTGLGLYIVSNFVHSHHGKIDVNGNSPQGSVFTIEIPLK